jgi:hypothetical protein
LIQQILPPGFSSLVCPGMQRLGKSLLEYLMEFIINLLSIWLFMCSRYRTAFRLFNLEPLAKRLGDGRPLFHWLWLLIICFHQTPSLESTSCSWVTDRKTTQKVGRNLSEITFKIAEQMGRLYEDHS